MTRPFGAGRRCADSPRSGCGAATAASKIARRRGRRSVMASRSSRGTCDAGYPSDSGKRKPPQHAAGTNNASCPGRGAAFFTMHRRAGTHSCKVWAPDQQRTASRCAASGAQALAPDVAVDDVTEALPGLALESLKLNRGDRGKVSGAGIDLDARKQKAELQISDAGRLLHDVRSREVVAAGLQHMHQALRDGVTVHQVGIDSVAFREVLGEELVEGLHAGIVLPLRIGRILQVVG